MPVLPGPGFRYPNVLGEAAALLGERTYPNLLGDYFKHESDSGATEQLQNLRQVEDMERARDGRACEGFAG